MTVPAAIDVLRGLFTASMRRNGKFDLALPARLPNDLAYIAARLAEQGVHCSTRQVEGLLRQLQQAGEIEFDCHWITHLGETHRMPRFFPPSQDAAAGFLGRD